MFIVWMTLLIGLPTFFFTESSFPINMMFKHDDEEEVSGSEGEEEKEGEHAVSVVGGGGGSSRAVPASS